MSVRGSLGTMSIEDVLDWIDRRALGGTLRLVRGKVERKLEVAGGKVTGVSSDDPAEYLGQLLVNAGVLDEDGLRRAYLARGAASWTASGPRTAPRRSLGRTLVDLGLVGEAALREVLEAKVTECVTDALSWSDGAFEWTPVAPDAAPRAAELSIAMPLRALLESGRERAAEWRRLRALIPGDEQRFWIPRAEVAEGLAADSDEALILACVRRELTVREIALERHAARFTIWRKLGELIDRGWIRIDRRRTTRPPGGTVARDPETLIAAALGRRTSGDKEGALAHAKQALDAAPHDERIRKAYHDIERTLFAELSRSLLGKYRVPRLVKRAQDLEGLELTPEERYFVGRIDGRWDLLSLMRVSPLREAEALITLQKLAARGVITLD